MLEGGGGTNGFYFGQNFGTDIITDFDTGFGPGHDFIIMEEANEPLHYRQRGDDLIISTDRGDKIILLGAGTGDIDIFVADNVESPF